MDSKKTQHQERGSVLAPPSKIRKSSQYCVAAVSDVARK